MQEFKVSELITLKLEDVALVRYSSISTKVQINHINGIEKLPSLEVLRME